MVVLKSRVKKGSKSMAGEGGLGREHYYLDFSAHLDENIDKVNTNSCT